MNKQDRASRQAITQMIEQKYAHVHAARPVLDYPFYRHHVRGEKIGAALGYRHALSGRLFLEAYLDEAIEAILTVILGCPVRRSDIVEIGNMAAEDALSMMALWVNAANDLANDSRIAVAVLTEPLQAILCRLGINLIQIAPASPERLGNAASGWGEYYELNPIVCAAFIAEGRRCLQPFASRWNWSA